LLLPLLVSLALWVMIGAAVGLVGIRDELAAMVAYGSLFILPTLYGSIVFYADQRQRRYQFFAEHGIGGRGVWLVRNAVWLIVLVVILALIVAVQIAAIAGVAIHSWREVFLQDHYWQAAQWAATSAREQVGTYLGLTHAALQYAGKVLLAPLAAFAVGQFCSMILRSPILAAFLSLVLSVVLAAWMFIVFAWQLNAWLFVAPIILAFFLATWLRAPDWIEGRNSLRAWLKPLAAVLVPLAAMALCLPTARLAQIPGGGQLLSYEQLAGISTPGETSKQQKTELYLQAARLASGQFDDDPLEPWYKYSGMGMPDRETYLGIDQSRIPEDELEAYSRAKEQHEQLSKEATEQALDLLVRAAEEQEGWLPAADQPGRWFDFRDELVTASGYPNSTFDEEWTHPGELYSEFRTLLSLATYNGDTLDEFLAGLTLSARIRAGQPARIFVAQLRREQRLLEAIARWAGHEERTVEELRDAQQRLQRFFSSLPDPKKAPWADAALVHDTIQGDVPPLFYSQPNLRLSHHLAYLANQIPWERERALRALDVLTALDVERIQSVEDPLFNNESRIAWQSSGDTLRARITAARPESVLQFTRPDYQAARTSYLASMEYQARVRIDQFLKEIVDAEVRRRALGLQLALITYLRQHGEYPGALELLLPDHLAQEPFDPYTGEAFRFEPAGLSLPIHGGQRDEGLVAGTPILWSPGIASASFQFAERSVSSDDPDAEPQRERGFRLLPDYLSAQTWSWSEEGLVFPLPAPDATPAVGGNDAVE
jgi:hypothetical protein